MANTHDLKINPEYFNQIACGTKTFELRKNDRDYQKGDGLILKEYSLNEGYSGRILVLEVLGVFVGGKYGLDKDYCILSIKLIE